MKQIIIIVLSLAIAATVSGCGGDRIETTIKGNGNGCGVTACSNPPVPCNYDIVTGKCK